MAHLRLAFALLFFVVLLVSKTARRTKYGKQKQPPRLGETIPFVSNGWLFITNKGLFLSKARQALKTSDIVQYRLGPLKVHLINGSEQVATIFRSSFTSEPWVLRILQHSAGCNGHDLAKFIADKSGGASKPRHGIDVPPEQRIWYGMHHVYDNSLLTTESVNLFSRDFGSFFDQSLCEFQVGEWAEVRMLDFLKQAVTVAATRAIMGQLALDINPDFVEAFWEYEKHVETLAFGLPSWLNKPGIQSRDRFRGMLTKWFEAVKDQVDWNNEDPDGDPVFASRIARNLAHWTHSAGFTAHNVGSIYALFLFGLHGNTVPITCWVMIELMKDLELTKAVRDEVAQVTCEGRIDAQKLVMLPLLQSIYTEILRLHVDVLITRTTTEPVTMSGYSLPTGSILQAPTQISHLDESICHPASEFWAARHLTEVEVEDDAGGKTRQLQYSLKGRTGSFFPYGGGFSICAGRIFAKQEVLLAVAMMITRFDLEFIDWINADGTVSEKCPKNDEGYANAVAAPPDKDMKIRWRRLPK